MRLLPSREPRDRLFPNSPPGRVKHLGSVCALIALVLCVAGSAARSEQQTAARPGLSVQDGVLHLAGKPYRGMGVNYFNLFFRTLKDPSDKSYDRGLAQLAEAGIPFVRFMCGGYWPSEWELYQRDKDGYFRLLDEVVRSAERHRVGLVPSLFWTVAIAPDLVGEPVDQLGNPQSKSIAFIRQYTREVVTRYQHSPALWAWEFGNEFNLAADLPNAAEHRPPIVPSLKTPLTRSPRDELKADHMLTAFAAFAETVRSIDPHRAIITGNAAPRACAWHNWKEGSWQADTFAQFELMLSRDNPDPYDTISVHVYPEDGDKYPGQTTSLTDFVEAMQRCSRRARKPLFIGEFGAPATSGSAKERADFEELVEAIVRHEVPLSALWVFDYSPQDKDWNVTFDNARAYMLEHVARANARMSSRQP